MNEVIKSGQGGIHIDCPPQEFGRFIADLLKSSRTMSNTFGIVFDIGRSDIFDVVSLIRQRIREQHEHSLVESRAEIVFVDGRRTIINNLDEFESYADIGSKLAKSVSVSMVFLMKTPSDPVPQKQSISFKFSAKLNLSTPKGPRIVISEEPIFYESYASYKIDHTLVSFGEDMSNLLDRKLQSFMLEDLNSRLYNRWYFMIFYTTVVLLLSIGIAVLLGKLIGRAMLSSSPLGIADGITALQSVGVYLYAIIASAAVTIILSVVAFEWFFKPRPSFIRLSTLADSESRRQLKMHRKRLVAFAGTAVVSIAIGVMSSLVATGVWESLWGH